MRVACDSVNEKFCVSLAVARSSLESAFQSPSTSERVPSGVCSRAMAWKLIMLR